MTGCSLRLVALREVRLSPGKKVYSTLSPLNGFILIPSNSSIVHRDLQDGTPVVMGLTTEVKKNSGKNSSTLASDRR